MMKTLCLFAVLIAACLSLPMKIQQSTIPTLHQIQTFTFTQPYSCNSGSYKTSALFLSSYSLSINGPELLFNGNCQSPYFTVMMAGDDFGLISNLGDYSTANVSAHNAFSIGQTENTFNPTAPLVVNNTYSVLISRSDIRALYTFRALNFDQSTYALEIEYAVLAYDFISVTASAPGWSWITPNSY